MLQEIWTSCPYCGEHITLLADASVDAQQYTEDCQVCCKPMDVRVRVSEDGRCEVKLKPEND
jgi:hypothetical protein